MEISRIQLSKTLEVPFRCDLYVLNAIQNQYGTIETFERELVGMYPKEGSDSMEEGAYEMREPSIKALLFALPMMVREGFRAEKEENGRDIPDMNDMQLVLNIRRDYRLIADDIHEEMRRCFGVKKEESRSSEDDSGEDKKIDFGHIQVICVTRMGYTPRSAGLLYFGEYVALFEGYRKLYNFETQRMIYRLEEREREVARLSDL